LGEEGEGKKNEGRVLLGKNFRDEWDLNKKPGKRGNRTASRKCARTGEVPDWKEKKAMTLGFSQSPGVSSRSYSHSYEVKNAIATRKHGDLAQGGGGPQILREKGDAARFSKWSGKPRRRPRYPERGGKKPGTGKNSTIAGKS